jgi:dTDP-glucose 4,6-dehydratase
MDWKDVPVLVTGAGGFIGSHLAERLAAEGARVRAFVRYNSRGEIGFLDQAPAALRQRIEIVAGDLRDAEAVSSAMADCTMVFHLGALIAIPYSYVHPRETIEVNVLGTLAVLEGARRHHTPRVVHVSTSEVYGTAQMERIHEGHPLQGQSPYSASKIGADKIVESFHRAFDVPAVIVRPFNTYGPRQSARAVIPTIITQALAGECLRLGSTAPVRDFTFVRDTVAGMMAAAAAPGVAGREINLGADDEVSIGDLATRILAIVGRTLPIETDETRVRPAKSEVLRLRSDNRLALELLGWRPEVALDDGLRQTVEWIRANLHRYRISSYAI